MIDELLEVEAALSLNSLTLGRILLMQPWEIEAWQRDPWGVHLSEKGKQRLHKILQWLKDFDIKSNKGLNARFVRNPVPPHKESLVSLLESRIWNKKEIQKCLHAAKERTIQESQRREEKKERDRQRGFTEPTIEEKQETLHRNLFLLGLDKELGRML